MGKTEHQKLKILYILELLYEQTDEKHAVRMRDIIAYLNQKGISAERKSIYRDLEMLQDFGMDILREQEYRGGYYIGSRDFELAELKLLVDAVQSSKFITQNFRRCKNPFPVFFVEYRKRNGTSTGRSILRGESAGTFLG